MIIKIVKQNNVGVPYHPGIISNKIQRGELFWAHPRSQPINRIGSILDENNFDNQSNYTGRLLKAQFHSNPTTILYPSYYWLNLCQYKLTATPTNDAPDVQQKRVNVPERTSLLIWIRAVDNHCLPLPSHTHHQGRIDISTHNRWSTIWIGNKLQSLWSLILSPVSIGNQDERHSSTTKSFSTAHEITRLLNINLQGEEERRPQWNQTSVAVKSVLSAAVNLLALSADWYLL